MKSVIRPLYFDWKVVESYLKPHQNNNVKAHLKNILFLCITGMGLSVGIFFLTSQIGYTLNLIVYSKTCLKRPLNKRQKIVCIIKTDY